MVTGKTIFTICLTEHDKHALFVAVTVKRSSNAGRETRSKRIAGICSAARALGVTRGHLWAVLTQRRDSKPLIARYRALKKSTTDENASHPNSKANGADS
jgi:hypothetical protein